MAKFLEIPVDDEVLIQEVISNYNHTHKTDFNVVDIIEDEVTFLKIDIGTASTYHILNLGVTVGLIIEEKRIKGEVNY